MFEKLADFIIKRYKWIAGFSMIVFVLSICIAKNIGMDSGMEGMLPADSESLKATKEYEQSFDSQDTVLVVVKGEAGSCEAYLEDLGGKLQGQKTVSNILYKVEMDALEEYIHLYLDTEKYIQLEEELHNPASALSMFLHNKDFISFSELFIHRFENTAPEEQREMLDLFSQLLFTEIPLTKDEQKELFATLILGETNNIEHSSYIVSDSQEAYLMMIKPNVRMDNFLNDRTEFFDMLETSLEEVKQNGGYTIEAGITGGAFVQDYEGDKTMFQGFLSTALITFLIIILFIILSFRKIILPLSTAYPLILGAFLSTTFAYWMYQSLNTFSISFAVLLLGLGIDFGVHIISRYLEERERGNDTKQAIAITIRETSPGLFVGAITTAFAFLTFIFAEFKAFSQMGVISGVGILLLCFTMIFVVPAMIFLLDGKENSSSNNQDSSYGFLKPIGRVVEKRPLVVIVAISVIGIALIGNVWHTDIKTDISKIYPQNMECLTWLEVVEEEFDYNPSTLIFLVDTMEELTRITAELLQREDIKKVESILEYLPEDQDKKLNIIKLLNKSLQQEGVKSARPSFDQIFESIDEIQKAADRQGLSKNTDGYQRVNGVLVALRSDVGVDVLVPLSEKQMAFRSENLENQLLKEEKLRIDQLPESIRANFIGVDGKFSVEVVPDLNIWESENYSRISQAIYDISAKRPIGMPALMNEVTVYVKSDILRISLLCFAALFIVLWILFKSVKDAAIVLIPLVVSLYMTLGIMPMAAGDLNIFSIIAFPVLIGIGVDSGVHLLHRLKMSPDEGIPYILSRTGKAIMMTTFTTLIGFGSLCFTNHPGLSSFGFLTVVGMILCFLMTITWIPALYKILYSRS